jgi:hypothetical protein
MVGITVTQRSKFVTLVCSRRERFRKGFSDGVLSLCFILISERRGRVNLRRLLASSSGGGGRIQSAAADGLHGEQRVVCVAAAAAARERC